MPKLIELSALRGTPGGSKNSFVAEPGDQVEILDAQDVWIKVKLLGLPNEPVGWIPSAAIEAEADEVTTVPANTGFERIAALANRVFGNPAKADRWLREPKRSLDGQAPLTIIDNEAGEQTVREMLYRIEHGMFA